VRTKLQFSDKQHQIDKNEDASSKADAIDLEIVDLIVANSTKSMYVSCIIASLLIYLQADVSNIQTISIWAAILATVHLIIKIVATIYSKKTNAEDLINSSIERKLFYFRALAALCGASWGLLASFSFILTIIYTKHFWRCRLRESVVVPSLLMPLIAILP
jgi:hypothetical protein